MKINKKIIAFALSGVVLMGASCTANYEDINQNPYQPDNDDMQAGDYLLGAVLLNLQDKMMPEQENFAQYVECLMPGGFSGYVADSNLGTGWSGRFATYNPSQSWLEAPFNDFYTKFYPNYFQLLNQSEDEVYLALADLFRVATMMRVTDSYGPIPYSQVGAENSTHSPYDSQAKVYEMMFTQINAVIDVLTRNVSNTFPSTSDRIYGGNIEKWCKFANTLKLRMAMRIVYADEATARTMAEEAVNSAVGVMTEQSDGAFRRVADHNPWERFMPNWNDARISADLTCYMNGYNDPRRATYYGMTTFQELKENPKDIEPAYNGLRRGIAQGSYDPASHGYSCMNVTVSDDILVMPASEAAFLCAEGALRGWNMKGIDAKTYYEKGITLSFAERNAEGAAAYMADTESIPAAYTDPLGHHSGTTGSKITVAWKETAGFDEENLERIITQKWIAIFPNCMEAWSEYRRTGYPRLMPAVANLSSGAVSDTQGARRLPYPAKEYRENGVNVQAGVAVLATESSSGAGDNMGTHVWWDCNPNIK